MVVLNKVQTWSELVLVSGGQSEGAKGRNPIGERPVHPRGHPGVLRRVEGLVQRGIRHRLRHWEVRLEAHPLSRQNQNQFSSVQLSSARFGIIPSPVPVLVNCNSSQNAG